MRNSKYNFFFNNNAKYYVYNTLTNSFIEIEKIFSDAIETNDLNFFTKEELEGLKRLMIITTETEETDIINNLKLNNLLHRFNTEILNLTITPTFSCNFDCSYCYEKNKDNIFMTYETEEKIIDFIKSYGSISNLGITWFGGEPFLFFKRIKSLTGKLKKMELSIVNSIVSNGFILNKGILEWMNNNKMGYIQITLDGLEETHNKKRPH